MKIIRRQYKIWRRRRILKKIHEEGSNEYENFDLNAEREVDDKER